MPEKTLQCSYCCKCFSFVLLQEKNQHVSGYSNIAQPSCTCFSNSKVNRTFLCFLSVQITSPEKKCTCQNLIDRFFISVLSLQLVKVLECSRHILLPLTNTVSNWNHCTDCILLVLRYRLGCLH